jgi:IS605 OrfB family transposase
MQDARARVNLPCFSDEWPAHAGKPLHIESRLRKTLQSLNRHANFALHHAIGSLVSYRNPWRKSLREFAMDHSYDGIDGAFQMTPATRPVQHAQTVIRTFRLKVKAESYAWLAAAAAEVNQVWNWANATSYKAAYPFSGSGRWLSGYDLDRLCVGASGCFSHIGSDTIQRVNAVFAARRQQFKKAKLRWRVSHGAQRSLGWIPFKAGQLKRKGKSLRFSGKAFRVFEREALEEVAWKSGCFAQDALGDWWLCLAVERTVVQTVPASCESVGLDLGLKDTVATSDGDKLETGHFYRRIEQEIALARRRGHQRQAKRLQRTAMRRRQDALHKYSRKIVDRYRIILIGDVNSPEPVKTRKSKFALGAGWGMLKTQLQYKGQQAGRSVRIVQQSDTARICSSCRAFTGPADLRMLAVRIWVCSKCGDIHDRDVNAAKNILSAGRCPPSVNGNESSPTAVPPSQTTVNTRLRISTLTVAA